MKDKILIVDDSPSLREELKDFLDGYGVMEAASGDECPGLLKKANQIGLVILDVMMPGLSGLEALRRIKETDADTKIIILTGHSSKDIAIDALKSHADDFIEKPFDPEELKDSIDTLLAKKRGELDVSAMDINGKIKKVKDFIQENRFKKTSLESAAAAVYMSPKYLSRIFGQVAGENFNDYKLTVKIEAAKEILGRTANTVNQISYKLGYENPESFIRQFKKRTGKTPTEYRTKIKNKNKKR